MKMKKKMKKKVKKKAINKLDFTIFIEIDITSLESNCINAYFKYSIFYKINCLVT